MREANLRLTISAALGMNPQWLNIKIDKLVKSRKAPVVVIPTFAGMTALEIFYEAIKIEWQKLISEIGVRKIKKWSSRM